MIISNKQKQVGIPAWLWKTVAVAAFVCIIGVMFLLFLKKETPQKEHVYFCNAEVVKDGKFIGRTKTFKNGKTQSSEMAFSGKYSSKTGMADGLTFGISVDLSDFIAGESYKVSVWRFEEGKSNSGILVAAGNKGSDFYQSAKVPVDRKESGWEKLQLSFNIPEKTEKDLKSINIHVYSPGNRTVYFDDLKIELISDDPTTYAGIPELGLEIKTKGLKKIAEKRKQALNAGLLVTGDDDWVKGKIVDGKSEQGMPVKLRLKGDWLDHLQGEKWSYRIKVKDPSAWNRLVTFSIHSPEARYFLHEWVYHQALEKEDILTTRYDFVNLKINGESKGIYAWEEHFEKQLVESRNRREGPIVKISEDAMWETRRRFIKHLGYIVDKKDFAPTNQQENATIQTFGESKIFKNETLKKQYEIAQNLMFQYIQGIKPVAQVFDIERLAKYMAMTEAFQTGHGVIWHNQRFYYNPITSKLEPIGFDGFVKSPYTKYYFMGMGGTNSNRGDAAGVLSKLFLDKEFTERYVHYLHKFTSREYMNEFLTSIEKEAIRRLRILEKEYPDYKYKPERFVELAQVLHQQIQPFPKSVKAYTQSSKGGRKQLKINSIHHLPVEILGYGTTDSKMTGKLNSTLYLEAQPPRSQWLKAAFPALINEKFELGNVYNNARKAVLNQELRKFYDLEVPETARFIYFKMPGVERVFVADVLKSKAPVDFAPQQELFENLTIASNSFFDIENDSIVFFKKGKHSANKDILIPENYRVFFPEGTEIDLVNNAKFLSKSPVFSMGTQTEPVKIFSSDGTGRGFTVLSPGDSCILNYTEFSGLNTMSHKGWGLTGAVTFHEAQVSLENCLFENNSCEDGVNLIRSEFLMKKCTIRGTFSDGFDADFCIGEVKDSYFEKTGNDGMDFSGSTINIYETTVNNAGDKGISVGEESEVRVINCRVYDSVIGLASKDFSMAIVDDLVLKNCETGFAAYQKKPEFGPSKILINKYNSDNLRRLYSLANGSTIQFPDENPILD